jgi:anthranilate phosphoribosyltransferase
MSPEMAEIAIGEFLKAVRERLEQAASIAKAAEACAEAGNPEKGRRDRARRRATDLRGDHAA